MVTVTVAVPSFRRPLDLQRCLEGIAQLEDGPDETLVVLRPDDVAGREVARAASGHGVRIVDVLEPGHLPPLRTAVSSCRSSVVAVLDDDAVPREGWIRRMREVFADTGVAALAGPVCNHGVADKVNQRQPSQQVLVRRLVRRRARTWYRGFSALPTLRGCVDAGLTRCTPTDVAIGCNMAFRCEVLVRVGVDLGLNGGAAVDYEADLCLGASGLGRVLFDPSLVVDHYPSARVGAPARDAAARYAVDHSYNICYIAAKRFPFAEQVVFMAYMVVVGQRRSPGLLQPGRAAAAMGTGPLAALAALSGARLAGWRAGRRARSAGQRETAGGPK